MPTNSQAPRLFWFYRLVGIGAIVGAVYLKRGSGSLMGLLGASTVRDAIVSMARDEYSTRPGYLRTREISVDGYVFMFEESRPDGKIDPNSFFSAWVMRGWPGYDKARVMYQNGEWRKLIAKALNISPTEVSLGFGHDQFDVRPF